MHAGLLLDGLAGDRMTFFAIVIVFFAFTLRFSERRSMPDKRFAAISTWALAAFALYAVLSADRPATFLYRALLLPAAIYTWNYTLRYRSKAIIVDPTALVTAFVDDYFADLRRTIKRISEIISQGRIGDIVEKKFGSSRKKRWLRSISGPEMNRRRRTNIKRPQL